MKKSKISQLAPGFRYLQTLALKSQRAEEKYRYEAELEFPGGRGLQDKTPSMGGMEILTVQKIDLTK